MKVVENNSITSPVRQVAARVRLFNGSTVVATYYNTDILKSYEIERIGESGKFFGFGIIHKATIKLLDKDRALNITTDNSFKIFIKTTESGYTCISPTLYVSEVHRDENTNELSITAYDILKKTDEHTVGELALTGYTPNLYIHAIAELLGIPVGVVSVGFPDGDNTRTINYENSANFDGTETLRSLLNAIAEVTQSIYYLDIYDCIVLKRLSTEDAVLTIDKSQYITLDSSTNRRLAAITHETELGDNVTAALGITGTTQIIRDNPFWNLRDDIDTHLNTALNNVGGITINQFTCNWRGNYLLEIGDKIALVTKDNKTVTSYVLDDVISYSGSLTETTQWSCSNSANESESNPTTLGESLKSTYARVDKANKRIDLVASDVDETKEAVAQISITTDEINQSVKGLADSTDEALEGVNEDIAELYSAVETKMTKDDYTIVIKDYIDENGVEEVIMENGYKFTREGLIIEDVDGDGNRVGETATKIDNNGMRVYDNNDDEVLAATDWGVNAKNLHATTYLIIGTNSRFEDYGTDRTGCFWVGGA